MTNVKSSDNKKAEHANEIQDLGLNQSEYMNNLEWAEARLLSARISSEIIPLYKVFLAKKYPSTPVPQ